MTLKKDRPVPTLADDILVSTAKSIVNPKVTERVRSILRLNTTKRFVLTEEAATLVGRAIRKCPEMLVQQGWFARAPFPNCWIEIPSVAFHEAIIPGSSSPNADDRVGYLFTDDGAVYVGASGPEGADISPLVYQPHGGFTPDEQNRICAQLDVTTAQLDNFYWGATMTAELDSQTRRDFRQQHKFSVEVAPQFRNRIRGEKWLGFSAGEVRNIIGLLLMLNQPSGIVQSSEVARRKMMTHRGSRVLLNHSVVTLHLGKRDLPSLFRRPRTTHGAPRWHEVMDHWCNDRVARQNGHSEDDVRTHGRGDHAHSWEPDDRADGRLSATCSICGGKRWRRSLKNGRGDRSYGTIVQDRIVASSG